ncbi:MAG: hypothetical protein AB7H93_14345 [Vicinamibacterales bacterium]
MKGHSVGRALGLVLLAWGVGGGLSLAQAPAAPQLPRGQVPDRGRPTKADDEVPLFDFERYFVGKWTFEWDVPDSPLGPSGTIKGVEVVKPGVEGKFYDAEYEGEGPAGKFTGRARMVYLRDNKSVVRQETDSRGFSMLKAGPIGGDLGGYYTIYYETGPFTHNGHVINLRTTTALLSPVNYRVRAQISVDGGAFTNFGNPWYRKELSPPSPAPGNAR